MQRMRDENLCPYVWNSPPNFRYPVRSHGYDKTLYCVQGTIEIGLAHSRERVLLRAGDRVDLPRGSRYSVIVGPEGARCVEGSYA